MNYFTREINEYSEDVGEMDMESLFFTLLGYLDLAVYETDKNGSKNYYVEKQEVVDEYSTTFIKES